MAFIGLATANSGGYRYGISDLAFYMPAVVLAMDPGAYPRDAQLIAAQGHLLLADDLAGSIARATGASLPAIFLSGYLATLVVLLLAAVSLARALGASWWAAAALGLILTLRHRIPKTGANSLEGYMHPRMLAFALGIAALAALVRGRGAWAAAWVGLASLVHPTTALWFGLAVGAGLLATAPAAHRRALWLAALAAVAVAVAAVLWGPLSDRLVTMDADWLAVFGDKDYLFPAEWPLYAWVLNLLYPAVVLLLYRRRVSAGAAAPAERAVMAAAAALVVVFAASVPLIAWRVALAVQLQVTRVFWLLDVIVAAYLAWWLMDDLVRSRRARIGLLAAMLLASAGRGAYIVAVEKAGARLVEAGLPDTPWQDAMDWIARQPAGWHVLADPGHAFKYGTSVRVAARRDVLVEGVKDAAIGFYDRDVAMRVADRLQAVGDYTALTADDLRRLQARYDLDVAVLETPSALPLPVLFRNRQFVVYALR
jgi:hypothetical protein